MLWGILAFVGGASLASEEAPQGGERTALMLVVDAGGLIDVAPGEVGGLRVGGGVHLGPPGGVLGLGLRGEGILSAGQTASSSVCAGFSCGPSAVSAPTAWGMLSLDVRLNPRSNTDVWLSLGPGMGLRRHEILEFGRGGNVTVLRAQRAHLGATAALTVASDLHRPVGYAVTLDGGFLWPRWEELVPPNQRVRIRGSGLVGIRVAAVLPVRRHRTR